MRALDAGISRGPLSLSLLQGIATFFGFLFLGGVYEIGGENCCVHTYCYSYRCITEKQKKKKKPKI
jgi:hypothetical protein